MITLHTNMGDIEIKLDTKNTPKTAENFIQYAKSGHYDGTIFHRVIDGFMIQGGGFRPGMEQKPTRGPGQNEADHGLKKNNQNISIPPTPPPPRPPPPGPRRRPAPISQPRREKIFSQPPGPPRRRAGAIACSAR